MVHVINRRWYEDGTRAVDENDVVYDCARAIAQLANAKAYAITQTRTSVIYHCYELGVRQEIEIENFF